MSDAASLRANLSRYRQDAIPRLRLLGRQLGPFGFGGVALLLGAVLVAMLFVSPVRRQAEDMSTQLAALAEARSTMRDRTATPADRTGDFLSRFPTRDELPSVLAAFEASAGKSGVSLLEGSYRLETPKGATLSRYSLLFPVKGRYPAVRAFIDRALMSVPAASLDSLRLERREVAEAVVDAELRFTVFVRSTP